MALSEPYDSLWQNCHLATMTGSGDYGIIHDGAIAVRNGRMIWVGPAQDLPVKAAVNANVVQDLAGTWVTPGLIDCHTHLVYAGNRANEFEMRLQGADYQKIARMGGGIISTVRAVRAAREEDLYLQSLPRLQVMMDNGVTTLEIKSGYGLDLCNELKLLKVIRRFKEEMPLRIVPTFLGAHAIPPEYTGKSDQYVDVIVNEMLPEITSQGLATSVDVFCEKIGFSLAQTERIFQAAKTQGMQIKLHGEQLSDSKGALLAARYNALSVDHLEYLACEDVPLLAKSACVAVMLPGAFYYLNETRKPPVAVLRAAGVPMAISTDANPGTSPILSPLIIMNMACVLFQLTPAEALAGVTINAARALGLENEIGSLEVSKAADFLIWDIDSPTDLAYQLGGSPLLCSVIGGKRRDRAEIKAHRGSFS